MTTKPVPTNLMAKEPAALTGGSISVALWAIIGILRTYGVVIPEDVGTNVIILLNLLAGIPAVAGFITRFLVYSPASAQKIANDAAVTGVAADTNPPPATKPVAVPRDQWGVNRVNRDGAA